MKNNTQQKLDSLARKFSEISADDVDVYGNGDAPNGKYYRSYNQREALAAVPEAKTNRVINRICDELKIEYKNGNTWRINQVCLDQIKNHLNKGRNKDTHTISRRASVVMIGILKGGAGKTSVATILATGMVSQASRMYRVLLIDLDPQKTASSQLVPNMTKKDISIGDLMIHQGTSAEFSDKLELAIKETNFPNLNVITAADRDRQYDIFVKEQEIAADQKGESYSCYKDLERVIKAVENDYDLILIDTPPHFTASNLSAHFVADNIVMPVKPSELDWDSAGMYMSFLSRTYDVLRYLGHEGYKNIKLLISAQSPNSNAESRLAHKLRMAAGMEHCFVTAIPRSDAILATAEQRCTIFDMSVSEFSGTKTSLRKAQESANALINEFELMINE
tara:strand:+ start:29013 stop:30191 length:1179 start_codon:yes stop_codon:yes gene_type:complete